MSENGLRYASRLLIALLLSGWVMGVAQTQAPNPPAASPPAGVNPAPAASEAGGAKVEIPEPPDKVVLKVGDQQFTKADIDALITSFPPQTQQALAVRGKKQLGEQYSVIVILSQQAKLHHLDQTPAFSRKLAFQKQQLEAQSAFEEISQQAKVTPEEIQQYYTAHAADYDELMVRQVVIRKKAPAPPAAPVTPAAETLLPSVRVGWVGNGDSIVRAKLEKNQKVSGLNVEDTQAVFKFSGSDEELAALLASLTGAGVKVLNFDETKPALAHPITPLGQGLSPEDAKARAEAIRKELAAGTDIKKVMEDFKAPGDVTIDAEPHKVRRAGLPPGTDKEVFALKDGEVSEPVDFHQSYLLIQVTGHSHLELKDVSAEIERNLQPQKINAALEAVKKSTTVWMDDQYFAAIPKPQQGPTLGAPAVAAPAKP